MKKNLALVLVLALVMAVAVVAFAACGGETHDGEYSYENAYNPAQKYGCKVKVTVNNGTITKVVVVADTADFFNLSEGWKDKETGEDTQGKKDWIAKGDKMAQNFVGMKVEDVLAITVACQEETVGSADTYFSSVKGQPIAGGITGAPADLEVVTGATQSSGRLILAVQNALGKFAK